MKPDKRLRAHDFSYHGDICECGKKSVRGGAFFFITIYNCLSASLVVCLIYSIYKLIPMKLYFFFAILMKPPHGNAYQYFRDKQMANIA